MMDDLSRLHLFIQRRLSSSSNVVVVSAGELLVGKKAASLEETLSAFSAWGKVHGSTASYTRMALSLVDCHFNKTPPATPVVPPRPPQQQKRPRSESTSSFESGSEQGQPIPALSSFRPPGPSRPPSQRGFTRGGSRGSGPGSARFQDGEPRRRSRGPRPRRRQPRQVKTAAPPHPLPRR
jgi:hypothetical protein